PESSAKSISAIFLSRSWSIRSRWWSNKRRNSFRPRRFTCTYRQGTRSTGASIVRSTTLAAGGSTSCAMTGTTTNTYHDTSTSTATTIMLRAMVMVKVMTRGTAMTKDTIIRPVQLNLRGTNRAFSLNDLDGEEAIVPLGPRLQCRPGYLADFALSTTDRAASFGIHLIVRPVVIRGPRRMDAAFRPRILGRSRFRTAAGA